MRFDPARRPESRPKDSPSRSLAALALCVALAFTSVLGGELARAQTALSPIDSLRLADSLAKAESLRVRDSTDFADSVAAEEQIDEGNESFGNRTSILDRQRQGGPINYNTGYSINRTNKNWNQSLDFYVKSGRLEVANVTTATVGRETRVGRVNRNRNEQLEMAYRVSPMVKLGGRLGLQRVSDEAQTANFTPTKQDVDDLSAQARFSNKFGPFPVRAVMSYGYLKNAQFDQQSKGRSYDFYGSTSRAFPSGTTVNFDLTQQASNLTSTVASDPTYLQEDKNSNTSVRLSSNMKIVPGLTADARVSTQRSVIRRPAQILDPLTGDFNTRPETVNGTNDLGDLQTHIRLPYRALLNVGGTLSRNQNVYEAEENRSSVVDRKGFNADIRKPLVGMDVAVRYEEYVTDNDYTRNDPGYVESNLNRKLDFDGGRSLGRRTSARFTGTVTLTRRRYEDYVSSQGGIQPSDQDQLRARGQLNLNYRPGSWWDTGLTLALEQNELVNLAGTSSINNATLRTYSVTWNWSARPGNTWSLSQFNTASAAQQYYTFAGERDQLSFIYNMNTTITAQLTQKIRLDLNDIIRINSRGSYLQSEGARRFGKSNEFNTLDLSVRALYQISTAFSVEAGQRLAVNPNYTFVEGVQNKLNETRRNEFTVASRFSYPLSRKAFISGDIRRVLADDRSLVFGAAPSDNSTNQDYWFASATFRWEIGL